ncbi:hypothetical protein Franean1_5073 [Parafrankia sp. EAN1pec]|uniref:hypothetical protein n=1 Tax=Parafrankia sp. (strain EAN1pec) TaxID=298653 RepID=UPI0000541D1F|nr:hypothetical protein Franean1_5073 [Frankia sp. EAN1pec]
MTDDLDLLTRLGADVPPLSAEGRARVRARLLAGAAGTANAPTHAESNAVMGADCTRPPRLDVLERVDDPGTPPRRRRRALRLGVVGAAAAAVSLTAALVLPGSASPAYALSEEPDGTVKVQINEFRQAKQLEADLRAAGINAVVDFVPIGQTCQQLRGGGAPPAGSDVAPPAEGGVSNGGQPPDSAPGAVAEGADPAGTGAAERGAVGGDPNGSGARDRNGQDPSGQTQAGAPAEAGEEPAVLTVGAGPEESTAFEVTRGALKPGQSLVIVGSYDEADPSRPGTISSAVVEGQVAPCAPVRVGGAGAQPGLGNGVAPSGAPGGAPGGTTRRE